MILPKLKEQKVAVLIDVQNLYHSAKNLFLWWNILKTRAKEWR